MKKTLSFLVAIPIAFIVLPNLSFAGVAGCGCYCGKVLSPPCSDDACKRACGWKDPSSGPSQTQPSYDYEAEQHAQANTLNTKGIDYYNAKNWEAAADYFQRALAKWPENQTFRNNLENAQNALQQHQNNVREDIIGKLDRQVHQDNVREDIIGKLDRQVQEDVASKLDRQEGPSSTQTTSNRQIAKIMQGLRNIKVPPPIPPDSASVGFRLIDPKDKTSEDILLGGVDAGVAVAEVTGRLAGTAIPATKIILATGKVFIAMENGADVYLVRQNKIYEHALKLLRDKDTAPMFTKIARALKQNTSLPKNAPSEMVSVASAIIDRRLGSSSMRIAWGAMWSPDARRAGLTKACIELGGELIGHGVQGVVSELTVARDPAFRYASNSLNRAQAALKKTTDPADQAAIKKVINEANRLIARSYKAAAPAVHGMGEVESIFSKYEAERLGQKD